MRATGKNGTKKQDLAEEIARVVGAGRPVAVETVDFNDPTRPKTCLEVDFPIVPVNHVAIIEGNAGKPIYQMSKWWARRRSSVFRSTLLAASMKAPADPAQAAKAVWDVYYADHQKKGALRNVKVADIFMGGGTTVVEATRLGMQVWGTDLNPVAWFIVKNELANVSVDEVNALLADIEAEVKPQIMPFYVCDCPRGHRGRWTHVPSGRVMDTSFDALTTPREERSQYRYDGPEIIYVFWAKHGPCQVTGCGHRTPVMSSPVMAVKTIAVKVWRDRCRACGKAFDIEENEARMTPGVPLVIAETEALFTVLDKKSGVTCPHCGDTRPARLNEARVLTIDGPRGMIKLGKGKNKKIELSLLVHPEWLAGTPKLGPDGNEYGGSATDTPEATAAWSRERARRMRLVEVRGALPPEVTCPETKVTFSTEKGTVPKKSNYACGACGTVQDVLETVKRSGKTGPVAAYAIQGYCPSCDRERRPYGGRFFAPVTNTAVFDAAGREWAERSEGDLKDYWPRSELPYGFMTHLLNGGIPNHGFTHWWKMFNRRQLLVHTQLLRAIIRAGGDSRAWEAREYVLGAFQQYLRNQNMFAFWNPPADKLEPMFSNANYHPKSTVIENSVFPSYGRGNWRSCTEGIIESIAWARAPWELVSREWLAGEVPEVANGGTGKSEKILCGDPLLNSAEVVSVSATDLSMFAGASFDLVITDPPFGGLLHYSELADFFYVWLRLVLKDRYADYFSAEYAPKALEVVSNRARAEDPDAFYKRLLTQCWREAHRILKPGGILAFTFHHSEDAPWVAVLESLFEAGFYLEATYPIRSDETKGEGEFGARKQEYDIIHVCRKRMDEPTPVSWGRMRREVFEEIRGLRSLLEHHAKAGLPPADIKLIKYGKALEYYSRHYGKVYVDEGRMLAAADAVAGIVQLVEEEASKTEPPPVNAEPLTRQLLRIFDSHAEQPRDQLQKFLRGTSVPPEAFETRGWCREEKKIFHLVSPLAIARAWQGRHRRNMVSDYDQAMVLIGACFDGSGINASETLKNENFKPHPALGALLEWHARKAASQDVRNAAARALAIFQVWERAHPEQVTQLSLFYAG